MNVNRNVRASDRSYPVNEGQGPSSGRYLTGNRSRADGGSRLDIDRSAQNTASWATYLPAECVATMISLGWDRST